MTFDEALLVCEIDSAKAPLSTKKEPVPPSTISDPPDGMEKDEFALLALKSTAFTDSWVLSVKVLEPLPVITTVLLVVGKPPLQTAAFDQVPPAAVQVVAL